MALSFLFLLSKLSIPPTTLNLKHSNLQPLVNRQLRIHILCPGINSAFEVLQFLETRTGKQLNRTHGTGAAFAEDYHIFGAVEFS